MRHPYVSLGAVPIVDQPPPIENDRPAIEDAHDTWPAPPPSVDDIDDADTATNAP